jgi:hypothetical protein
VSSDAEIITGIRRVFATRLRPEHFTNHNHCDECAEHDEVLRSRSLDTLSIDDVGNPGWDPICFIHPMASPGICLRWRASFCTAGRADRLVWPTVPLPSLL